MHAVAGGRRCDNAGRLTWEARSPIVIGQPVLIVVDIQRGYGLAAGDTGIETMDGVRDLVANAERVVAAARAIAHSHRVLFGATPARRCRLRA